MEKIWMTLAIVAGCVALTFVMGFWAWICLGCIMLARVIIKAINSK